MQVTPTKVILTSADNMNSILNEKYGLPPNDIERKSLSTEKFRTLFNFQRIERTKKYTIGWTGTIKRIQGAKEKMRKNLNVGENVLVLAERKRKKSAPGKFYKQSVQNIAHFNKEKTFVKELNKK